MFTLKYRDKDILRFDHEEDRLEIQNETFLPYCLKGITPRNTTKIMTFFHHRRMSNERANAKQILDALSIPHNTDSLATLHAMKICKAISITDDYWLTTNPTEKWENINPRTNQLNEQIALLALLDNPPTINRLDSFRTPELTVQGTYPKAWMRQNGKLYLYKAGGASNEPARIEALVSRILDHTNVPHVNYTLENFSGRLCSKCESMVTDERNIVTAEEISEYCRHNNKNFLAFAQQIDKENFMKMLVVDYLIANVDRHSRNWGFFTDTKTNDLISLHPLYDHNNAFNKESMKRLEGSNSPIKQGISQRDLAKYAIKHCDFRISPPSKSLFPNQEAYESFQERADQLHLPIKTNQHTRT